MSPVTRFVLLVSLVLFPRTSPAQTYTASPLMSSGILTLFPYTWTGLIVTPDKSNPAMLSTGSGAVVRNPRVVFSCAHVVFDQDLIGTTIDPWVSGARWHRAWFSSVVPSSGGQLLRGYIYYTSYSDAAKKSSTAPDTFALDFVVHYSYEDTANGGYAGYWENGVSNLQSSRDKLITGYPSGLYQSGDSRKYQMHSTGPFSRAFTVSSSDYLTISEVSTGKGNSGGPVWVSDGSSYYFAGVIVSGLARSVGDSTDLAGVYGVDESSLDLINRAITAGGGAVAIPVITTQPTSRRITVGQPVTLSVTATGSGLSYRWLHNGVTVPSATTSSLNISAPALSDAGTYQVVISNSGGEVRSVVVTLSVDSYPVISTQPRSQTTTVGGNMTISVAVLNPAGATYQWRRDGVIITGATQDTYTVAAVTAAHAGSYTVAITNNLGTISSAAAVIAVTAPNPGRLINLSILTPLAAGEVLTLGTVLGGAGTAGVKPLLFRAAGPSLAPLGVSNAHPNPRLIFYAGQSLLTSNDNWGGGSALATTFSQVGAFAYSSPNSLDAAGYQPALGAGSYTMQIDGPPGTAGTVIAELYDATTTAAYTTTTPRLINVSVLKYIGSGSSLTTGFVIGGASDKGVLIRAAGPTLGSAFQLSGVMADPRITLYRGQVAINSNDDWGAGGTATLRAAFISVGAFAFASGSLDAALLATLPPGNYSVVVGGVGTSNGVTLVEVYEMP